MLAIVGLMLAIVGLMLAIVGLMWPYYFLFPRNSVEIYMTTLSVRNLRPAGGSGGGVCLGFGFV